MARDRVAVPPVESVALLTVAVVAALVAAADLAFTWVDVGYDSTCGSVVRSGVWWGSDRCQTLMARRALLVGGLAALAVASVVVTLRSRSTRARVWVPAVTIVVSLGVLLANELFWLRWSTFEVLH